MPPEVHGLRRNLSTLPVKSFDDANAEFRVRTLVGGSSLCRRPVCGCNCRPARLHSYSRRPRRAKEGRPKKDEPNISAPHAILIDGENGGGAFRARCRSADLPGQPRQADDGGIRLQRDQGRPPQAHRRIHGERKCLAQRRRTLAWLHHVRGDLQQGARRRPDPRHDHPVGQ